MLVRNVCFPPAGEACFYLCGLLTLLGLAPWHSCKLDLAHVHRFQSTTAHADLLTSSSYLIS